MEFTKLVLAVLVIFIANRVVAYFSSLKAVSYLPGIRCLFAPISPFGAFLPTSKWNPGLNWMWRWRNTVYPRHGTETISIVSYIVGQPSILTINLDVARQIVSPKGMDWIKSEEISAPLTEYGPNVFSVEGDEWKRQRRILNPAFSPATYALVWDAAGETYREMIATEGWDKLDNVSIPTPEEITMKFALIIISRCGFGHPLAWDFGKDALGGMSFAQALAIVSHNHILRLVLPHWVYKLPIASLQKIDRAHRTLGSFMSNLIKSKRENIKQEEAPDVFTLMMKASEGEGNLAMNDTELAGNTFLMLFAGHDTTAHTLTATLGLLGLYPDVQEEIYQQIKEVAPTDADMTFQNSVNLYKVRAAFLEGGRLYPPAQMMLRDVVKPGVLTNVGPDGDQQIPVYPGTRLGVDICGINYNPRYYPEPEEFKLERWYDAVENDMTMFSFGPRSCIGRRFALTEATSFLARLLRDWKVDVVMEKGETRDQFRKRAMRATAFMTLRVDDFPIRLTRRR